MTDKPRLIEHAFPLKQASLDSVHEKNVRHGHISTLHIWPARRPLAACRAALIATLLPDPGTPEERQKLCERIGGKVVEKIEKKKMPNGRVVERIKEETKGGILHWLGSEPTSGGKKKQEEYRRKAKFYEEELEWFRQEIRKAYGGRTPRVLDPFAGGGAIPLEAMRLGCEVTAVDINPVAWFILKCTLEYPQKLAGKTHPLPDFILEDEEFMAAFRKVHGSPEPGGLFDTGTRGLGDTEKRGITASPRRPFSASNGPPEADLAWHVRAWGKWVLNRARQELAEFYPTYAYFEPLKPGKAYEKQPMCVVPLKGDGTADIDSLNAEFSGEYLAAKTNPRWVAKPTVAYLWARTVTCKNCRATVPLLKTRWLCRRTNKRVLLTMVPNPEKTGVSFGIDNNAPVIGGNGAQKREHDKKIGQGTMSSSGVACPCCRTVSTMEDLRLEGQAGRLGTTIAAVVVEGTNGKEYRLPSAQEHEASEVSEALIDGAYDKLPNHRLREAIPNNPRRFATPLYGMRTFESLFTPRQRLALAVICQPTRSVRDAMASESYPADWVEAVHAYLALVVDRQADYCSAICTWHNSGEKLGHTFARFALPMVWDYCEVNPISNTSGNYSGALEWVSRVCGGLVDAGAYASAHAQQNPAQEGLTEKYDIIVTDPPYYDAIPYSDISNYFYVWLRRTVGDAYPEEFKAQLVPYDRELVMDRLHGSLERPRTKEAYETGMAEAFEAIHRTLEDVGRLVIVFAHKEPEAWETLVGAMIRSGFIVDGSWPIQTEMGTRSNALGTASLASSVWLVCKKRPVTARPGWDNKVLEEMRANISARLREFWDAGIRGPDFVWAATGPALEAYSKHPVVKKANDPGKTMEVSEFLSHVRRMVVDYVVGQVLTGDGAGADLAAADRMDAPTAYYLLHRHDFGLEEAPSGACILYATACGLSDSELEATWDILVRTGGSSGSQGEDDEDEENEDADPDAEADPDSASDSGSKVKLKTWAQRKHKSMGYEAPGGQPVPLIDRIHRLMHLWRAGDVLKVDEYLDEHGLRRQELFKRLLQSLIELSRKNRESQELQTLESLSNHVQAKGATPEDRQATLFELKDTERKDTETRRHGDAEN